MIFIAILCVFSLPFRNDMIQNVQMVHKPPDR